MLVLRHLLYLSCVGSSLGWSPTEGSHRHLANLWPWNPSYWNIPWPHQIFWWPPGVWHIEQDCLRLTGRKSPLSSPPPGSFPWLLLPQEACLALECYRTYHTYCVLCQYNPLSLEGVTKLIAQKGTKEKLGIQWVYKFTASSAFVIVNPHKILWALRSYSASKETGGQMLGSFPKATQLVKGGPRTLSLTDYLSPKSMVFPLHKGVEIQ